MSTKLQTTIMQMSRIYELSSRETETLGLLASGKTKPSEIGEILGIADSTVRIHIKHIYHKLRTKSATASLARVIQHLCDAPDQRITFNVEGVKLSEER